MYDIHRLVNHLSLIKEAYFAASSSLKREPQLAKVPKIRDCGVLSPIWDFYLIPPPSMALNSCRTFGKRL